MGRQQAYHMGSGEGARGGGRGSVGQKGGAGDGGIYGGDAAQVR